MRSSWRATAGSARRGSVPQDERYRTHRSFRQLLELLAAKKPLVLLLDDLHIRHLFHRLGVSSPVTAP